MIGLRAAEPWQKPEACLSLPLGFLRRWNDTMATTREPEPVAFAHTHLTGRGWEIGAHTKS